MFSGIFTTTTINLARMSVSTLECRDLKLKRILRLDLIRISLWVYSFMYSISQ